MNQPVLINLAKSIKSTYWKQQRPFKT